jgi:hypothetical protein
MKTNLLLSDETKPTKLALQDVPATKFIFRETEGVAGCNCDRWGHPRSGCNDHKFESDAWRLISPPNRRSKNGISDRI